nr:MAG TPA: hypothetical protein [Caudoviricetes sp.]
MFFLHYTIRHGIRHLETLTKNKKILVDFFC